MSFEHNPPIPPNDNRFTIMCDGSTMFEWPQFGMGTIIHPHSVLDQLSEPERLIIAAVARCAWLDEAKKQWDEVCRLCDYNAAHLATETISNQPARDANALAEANAEAWRVWGEQK